MIAVLILPFAGLCAFGTLQLIFPKETTTSFLDQNLFVAWVTLTISIWFAFNMLLNGGSDPSSNPQKD